jgi:glycosyltransferase involved in cell wall biosynthesis
MKKILLISNKMMHYRVSVYNFFFQKFREAGYEFIVRANELQKNNANKILFDFKEVPFSVNRYRRELASINPDAVILFLHLKESIAWFLLHWLKLKNIPFAWWNKPVNLDDPENKFRYMLFNYVHSLSEALIVYSRHDISYIRPKNRQKVFVANNTINFYDFPKIADTKEEIKKQFDIPFDKVVLFVGRMDVGGGRKKVDHLFTAFEGIDIRGAGLVIIGSGLTGEMLSQQKFKNVVYLGEVHDAENVKISKIFKMSDVFCIPGHVGLGINQAMFWGLPVVTEEGGQPPEINYLVDGKNGYLVAENDIEALRGKIVFLLENDAARREMGLNATMSIMENASVERMYSGFIECAEYLLKAR